MEVVIMWGIHDGVLGVIYPVRMLQMKGRAAMKRGTSDLSCTAERR